MNKEFWTDRNVLVTGHTGFKGSWLSLWLQQCGANVTGYALEPPTDPSLFVAAHVADGMNSIEADVRDRDRLASAFSDARPEIVIHMAAQPLVRESYANPVDTYSTNIMGTVHVLDAARHTDGVRAVVIVTSDKCYENCEWIWGYRETDPLGGHDPYSSSKGCAELITAAYRRSFFVGPEHPAVASARAGNVIGGGDWARDRLIPDILSSITEGTHVRIRDPGAVRPWQHVLEPISGYLMLAEALWREGQEIAEPWNFGPDDDDCRPVAWVADELTRRWDIDIGWEHDLGDHPREAVFLKLDSTKSRVRLGWVPRLNIEDTLAWTADWHQAFAGGADARQLTLADIARYWQEGARKLMSEIRCRFCHADLRHTFCDLGMSPVSNAFVKEEHQYHMERYYPLHVYVCDKCHLVQLPVFQSRDEIFNQDYAYFSSYTDSWVEHAREYVEMMVDRFGYGANSLVVEIASNDGYLLQWFKKKEIPHFGIEPAANVAAVAEEKGIVTRVQFFGVDMARQLADEGKQADLLLGNNVLAHVPDINDFVEGMKIALKPGGVITMEFPHLQRLVEQNQFDTIYHEHFSYLSFTTVNTIFEHHGLTLFDVEELTTHGGSLRIFARHHEDVEKTIMNRVEQMLAQETEAGLATTEGYLAFEPRVQKTKQKLLTFLIDARSKGKRICGYGAPAKGNTLLNYCGIRSDFLEFTVDRSPYKQGMYTPGTHIPIRHPEAVMAARPDFLLILPWNIKQEVMEQMTSIREWGGKFVVPIPEVKVLD